MGALVISIQFYEGRYHGADEWPPAPARLFQALVAGAGLSGHLESGDREGLEWRERLDAPIIGAPRKRDGQSLTLYVPNNDLDKVGGDLRRIAEVRGSRKVFKPRLFDPVTPFIYAWTFKESAEAARNSPIICRLAERLYQFGRGVDFACAWAEELSTEAMEGRLAGYSDSVYRPSSRGAGLALKCPAPGSLKSLDDRHYASGRRFDLEERGKSIRRVFTKPPHPRFTLIAYDSPSSHCVFELHERSDEARFAAWPLAQTARLVELLRDGTVARLCSALPSQRTEIARALVGRKPNGSNSGPSSDRVKVVPLPSIGHPHADRGIRRILIDVPPNCPLRPDDVQWAFSGLELSEADGTKPAEIEVTPADSENVRSMLANYAIGRGQYHRRWRSVTPAALPESAARRRIDPRRRLEEAKGGPERAGECAYAAAAVVQALRHTGVPVRPEVIWVQREPFESNGERVEAFAEGTRFPKHRLWHVAIEFADRIPGPLVIGDGRFLGLGLMAPRVG